MEDMQMLWISIFCFLTGATLALLVFWVLLMRRENERKLEEAQRENQRQLEIERQRHLEEMREIRYEEMQMENQRQLETERQRHLEEMRQARLEEMRREHDRKLEEVHKENQKQLETERREYNRKLEESGSKIKLLSTVVGGLIAGPAGVAGALCGKTPLIWEMLTLLIVGHSRIGGTSSGEGCRERIIRRYAIKRQTLLKK